MDKDIEGALEYVTKSSKEMFRYNFELLKDNLPSVFQDMANTVLDGLKNRTAKYHMPATRDGKAVSFYIEFYKDADGIWKINFF